jgi:Terminase large subunit, T4likevirus-type, N-terminal
MSPAPIADIVRSLESLPPELKEQASQHLISYLEDLPEEAKWNAPFKTTEGKLAAEARKARLAVEARKAKYLLAPLKESIAAAIQDGDEAIQKQVDQLKSISGGKDAADILSKLLKYQKDFLSDDSRCILLNWFRASGKDTTATLKIVFDCADKDFQNERTDWVILSRGDREAFGIFQVARKYCEDFLYVFNSSQSQFSSEDGLRRYTQHEIRFPCGSRIISLPANPDTARGYSANFFLNELSTFERDEEIWQSVSPCLRSKHKIIVASTPRGDRSRLFYRLATDESGAWSKHVVDVHKAVEQGFPMDVEAERSNIDQLDWIQDYELNWLRTSD